MSSDISIRLDIVTRDGVEYLLDGVCSADGTDFNGIEKLFKRPDIEPIYNQKAQSDILDYGIIDFILGLRNVD